MYLRSFFLIVIFTLVACTEDIKPGISLTGEKGETFKKLLEENSISYGVDKSGFISYSDKDQELAQTIALQVINHTSQTKPGFIFAEKSELDNFVLYYEATRVGLDPLISIEGLKVTWEESKSSDAEGLINSYFQAEVFE
ncbi:hypothetical protein ACVFI8_21535 [Agarivorans sp. MS3-6]